MATSDSPTAMITINPCRSTKCAGSTRQPRTPTKAGPKKPTASAMTHNAARRPSSVNPAARISSEPPRTHGTTRWIASRRSRLPRAPSAYRVACMAFTMRNETPKTTPSRPNASGTASAATNIAAIAASTEARPIPSPGSIALVSHAYPAHAHHSAVRDEERVPEPRPGRVVRKERRDLREPEDEDEVEE